MVGLLLLTSNSLAVMKEVAWMWINCRKYFFDCF